MYSRRIKSLSAHVEQGQMGMGMNGSCHSSEVEEWEDEGERGRRAKEEKAEDWFWKEYVLVFCDSSGDIPEKNVWCWVSGTHGESGSLRESGNIGEAVSNPAGSRTASRRWGGCCRRSEFDSLDDLGSITIIAWQFALSSNHAINAKISHLFRKLRYLKIKQLVRVRSVSTISIRRSMPWCYARQWRVGVSWIKQTGVQETYGPTLTASRLCLMWKFHWQFCRQ